MGGHVHNKRHPARVRSCGYSREPSECGRQRTQPVIERFSWNRKCCLLLGGQILRNRHVVQRKLSQRPALLPGGQLQLPCVDAWQLLYIYRHCAELDVLPRQVRSNICGDGGGGDGRRCEGGARLFHRADAAVQWGQTRSTE